MIVSPLTFSSQEALINIAFITHWSEYLCLLISLVHSGVIFQLYDHITLLFQYDS